MKTLHRAPCLSMLISAADSDHFRGLDAQPGYKGPSTYYSNVRTPTL